MNHIYELRAIQKFYRLHGLSLTPIQMNALIHTVHPVVELIRDFCLYWIVFQCYLSVTFAAVITRTEKTIDVLTKSDSEWLFLQTAY